MENLNQASPMEGGADSAAPAAVVAPPVAPASGSGGSSSTGSESSRLGATMTSATTTARPQRTPGRWRRRRIPRANTSRALPAAGSSGELFGGIETIERWPWKRPDEVPLLVVERGSREWAEAMERSNKWMREEAHKLEQQHEDLCDTEEAKVAFRAFKAKFAAV